MSTETNARRRETTLAADLRQRIFRTNPDYELVRFDQLTAEENNRLGDLRKDPNFCGIIRPRTATGLTVKAVCDETARLLNFLSEPAPLPRFALGDVASELIVNLVYDGILQVAEGAEWICGPAVCRADMPGEAGEEAGVLANLSLQAIRHAAALETADAKELSSCLFRYNTLPVTPRWLQRIPDREALEQYLQIEPGGSSRRELDRSWARVSPEAERGVWMAWNSRSVPAPDKDLRGYKLYSSPHPSHLRESFRAWLHAIIEAGAYHFKIGGDVRGLLRADKMVAYFADWTALKESASLIAREIAGCPAQGVPFTAELDAGALLSWGSDPLEEDMVPDWLKRQSWRQWICFRLGSALAIAKREKSSAMPAWQFALQRLRLEGIDVATWTLASSSQTMPAAEVASS